jgi:branched-subunit amino acid ABC-type transport system permease component
MAIATFLGIHSANQFFQLFVAGLFAGSNYALVGIAFALIISVTGRFHFAFAILYTVTAYIAAVGVSDWGLALLPSALVGVTVAAVLAVVIEWGVYEPLARRAGENSLLAVFVASVGIVIVGENLIPLIWGNNTRTLKGFAAHTYIVAGVNFTLVQIVLLGLTLLIGFGLALALKRTLLGQQILAARSNLEMAQAVGVKVRWIFGLVFVVATVIGGVAALFDGIQYGVTPAMGETPLFYAFTVAFIAGPARSPIVVGAVGLAVGVVESVSTIWISENLSSVTVFGLLFIILAYRSAPAGIRELSNSVSSVRWRKVSGSRA